jgi:hypothetical protein
MITIPPNLIGKFLALGLEPELQAQENQVAPTEQELTDTYAAVLATLRRKMKNSEPAPSRKRSRRNQRRVSSKLTLQNA